MNRSQDQRKMKWDRFNRWVWRFVPALLLLSCQSVPVAPHADWADVTLRATGIGLIQGAWTASERIQGVQRAKVDVYTQLESKILMLKTESNKSIRELAAQDDQIQKKISAFVKGAEITQTENRDQGVEIVAELFLGENFKATLGLAERKQQPPSKDKKQDGYAR